MIIKILLICGIVAVAFLVARGATPRRLAIRRLGTLAFALVAIASVLQPDAWSAIARSVGVGRGVDLILYLLIVSFLLYIATRFAHDRRVEAQLATLAREVALLRAKPPPGPENENHQET